MAARSRRPIMGKEKISLGSRERKFMLLGMLAVTLGSAVMFHDGITQFAFLLGVGTWVSGAALVGVAIGDD